MFSFILRFYWFSLFSICKNNHCSASNPCIFSKIFPVLVENRWSHSPIHTVMSQLPGRFDHQEQLRVQCLAQGPLDSGVYFVVLSVEGTTVLNTELKSTNSISCCVRVMWRRWMMVINGWASPWGTTFMIMTSSLTGEYVVCMHLHSRLEK